MSSREAGGRNGNHECRPFSPAAVLLWFSNRNRAGKPIHQGFPSSNGDVKPGRKTRGVAALVTHIKHASLWAGCLQRSGSWDSGEWRGTLLFKTTEGKKRKTESRYRGLPVWEADLRVNLFSCLTSLSPSKTNREPKQSNQTVMLDKYTCPLNGYTPSELSFSFMLTSKVRKITSFVSLMNIILFIWKLHCFFQTIHISKDGL